jgi:hypothetical protein
VLQPIVNQQVQQVLTALDKQVAKVGGGGDGVHVETAARETPAQKSDTGGMAGAPPVSLEAEPDTDSDTKDYGPPADAPSEADPAEDAGASAAEEGEHPWEEESGPPQR